MTGTEPSPISLKQHKPAPKHLTNITKKPGTTRINIMEVATANYAAHVYKRELTAGDPMAPQPQKIRIELKAHQKAALAKAVTMEQEGCVHYVYDTPPLEVIRGYRPPRFKGKFKAFTNVGILGDLVGHGKTLTALSIIAATPTSRIHTDYEQWHSFIVPNYANNAHSVGGVRIVCEPTDEEIAARVATDMKYATTLIVVPRGPVFTQWRTAVETQTNLKSLVIDTLKCIKAKMPPPPCSSDELRTFFDSLDCIIIKTTTLKQLFDYYRDRSRNGDEIAIPGFERIIIDEAHDEMGAVPNMPYKFLWLVSSTFSMMSYNAYSSIKYISNSVRHLMDYELMSTFVIRGADSFVRASFELPRMQEFTYVCKMSMVVAALHSFLSANVQERLNVNDIAGAVREMGGKAETEAELVRMVTSGMIRDINNKKQEIHYHTLLDMDQHAREVTLARLDGELRRLEDKRASLEERLTALDNKQCAVCMDSYDEPVMLACTHVFCGQCVVDWMRARARTMAGIAPGCPTCRETINTNRMVAVVSEENRPVVNEVVEEEDVEIGTNTIDAAAVGKWKKEEILLRLLKRKPDGKWLIFTHAENGFVTLRSTLEAAGISFAELKGNTNVMMHTLDNFRRGNLKVILLHTQYAGSGIDISCATDVIIYHSMGMSKIQAVGRAQRVGRTTPLTVHNLLYPNEMHAVNAGAAVGAGAAIGAAGAAVNVGANLVARVGGI